MSEMASVGKLNIKFIDETPWRAADGSPRAGWGYVFEVDGSRVTIWVHQSVLSDLERVAERDRAKEAAGILIEMELDRRWDPKIQNALELTEGAMHWVRNHRRWKAGPK